MTDNKIKVVFGLIGGSLLIGVYYLAAILFYVAGLLVPFVYLIILFSAMYYANKKAVAPSTFASLFKLNLFVSYSMVLVDFLLLVIGRMMISGVREGVLVFLFNLAVATILSGVCAYLYNKIIGKE